MHARHLRDQHLDAPYRRLGMHLRERVVTLSARTRRLPLGLELRHVCRCCVTDNRRSWVGNARCWGCCSSGRARRACCWKQRGCSCHCRGGSCCLSSLMCLRSIAKLFCYPRLFGFFPLRFFGLRRKACCLRTFLLSLLCRLAHSLLLLSSSSIRLCLGTARFLLPENLKGFVKHGTHATTRGTRVTRLKVDIFEHDGVL
mmetsp:Transcript_45603/g.119781  ORF Transcript_45603/g.119781 Transcript_45603/m.119781 type:complete len:200 (+) Transcript_45603:1113-1712(+)